MKSRTFILTLIVIGLAAAPAAAQGPSQPIVLEHADQFNVRTEDGTQVLDLSGNVSITQGDVAIRSDRAVYNESARQAEFSGDVTVRQPGTLITAPRIVYSGGSRIATAPDGVVVHDSSGAVITGGWGEYDAGRRRTAFSKGVRLVDPRGTLRASEGEYYSVEQRADFRGDVRIVSDSGTVDADRVTHWRTTQVTYAFGNVVVRPKQRDAVLTGDTVRHYPPDGYTVASGSPRLVDIDTAEPRAGRPGQVDTTVIIADTLETFRGVDRLEYQARGHVRMLRSELQAMASIARYLPDSNVVGLGTRRVRVAIPLIDTAGAAKPDSLPGGMVSRDTASADTAIVAGRPPENDTTAGRAAPSPRKSDSEFDADHLVVVWYGQSQLSGDTVTVRLDSNSLRSVTAVGDAFAAEPTDGPERYNQFAGARLHMDVRQDTVRQVRSEGQASYLVFKYDRKNPDGVDRSSGDTIRVEFRGGDVSRIAVLGPLSRPEGEYFPEPMVAGQEAQFRLQGFRWFDRDQYAVITKREGNAETDTHR